MITIRVDDSEVKNLLKNLQAKMRDLTPVMKIVGQTIRTSVIKNFEQGGRPVKWKPSARASIKGDKTLIDTSRLMGSITPRAYSNKAEIGTNVIYSAIHQFGGKAGRGRKAKIPARPFLMVQEEDWKEIKETVQGYLLKK